MRTTSIAPTTPLPPVPSSSKNAIEASFGRLKSLGYTHVYWRVTGEGHPFRDLYYFNTAAMTELMTAAAEYANTPYAWDPYELRWPIEAAHKQGLKFYAWIVPHNEGCPPGTVAQLGIPRTQVLGLSARTAGSHLGILGSTTGTTRRSCISGGLHLAVKVCARPSWVSKCGPKRQALSFRGPRMGLSRGRSYWLKDVVHILDRYAIDGIYMDTRTESLSPEYADQFGFNEPIVKEFQRRHKVNILEEDFDLELWRSLRGEYFTAFLKELSAAIRARGKLFSLGTSRGDYIGFPLGNMKLEWRKWLTEKIVDEIHLDTHGWGWGTARLRLHD